MRRLLIVFSAFLLILAGCGSGSSEGYQEGDEVTLTFAFWDDLWAPAFEAMADEFEEAHPGVTIETQVTPYSSYWTKMDTIASTGDGPDIFVMNTPNIEKYYESGMLAPLDDALADQNVNKDDFVDRTFDAYEVDGATYGVPFNYDVSMLFYNIDLVKEAGIDKIPETWDEMLDAGQKILDYDSSLYPLVLQGNQAGYWPVMVSQGAEIITEDGKSGYESQEMLDSINWIKSAVENGIIPKSSSISSTAPLDVLQSGQAAFALDGSWMLQKTESDTGVNIGVAPIPSNNENRAGIIHAPAISVNEQSPNAEIATEFAAFVGTDSSQEKVATDMGQLAAKKGFDDLFVEKNSKLVGLEDTLQYTGTAAVYPHVIDGSWENVEIEDMNKVMDLSMEPQDAADDITAAIEKSSER
ncbi:MAG: ABC transporter substrate-binding protein [Anaerorhabdus sp.]|uniref:ABC transporter substrate-binding protein n=1 Tax=Anaerorhabdus sp. TaxID=1872524 RepID=UPI003A866BDC